MVEALEEKTKSYEPERYQYAAAAAQFLQRKDITSAAKSLDKMLEDVHVTEDIKKGMIWNVYNGIDPEKAAEGLTLGVQIYAGMHQEALGKKTINEMFERYTPEFDKYLTPEQKEKAKSVFGKLGDKTYAAISGEVRKLLNVIEDEKGTFSHEEKEKAQKEFDSKYADIFGTIQEYEELRISRLMPSIREGTIKGNVNRRFKVEEKKKGDEK